MIVKKNYSVRLSIVLTLFCALFGLIILRLYIIQIYNQDFYRQLAEKQYEIKVKQPSSRAQIYDRTHTALAMNKKVMSAFVLPYQCSRSTSAMAFLEKNYPQVFQRIKNAPNKKFMWLSRHLTEKQETFLRTANHKEIYFVPEIKRFYPFACCGSTVGFTNIDNCGISGIELAVNDIVQGESSIFRICKDARSRNYYFERELATLGKQGEPIALTLDHTLQFLAQEELKKTVEKFKAKKAAALIMNPDTGEILSMAQYPAFDPNNITNSDVPATTHFIATEQYELGSVIKVFTALAALEHGVVDLDEMIDCEGKKTYLGKLKVENWKSLPVLPFSEVVRQSSNVGTAKVAQRLGDHLYDYFVKLGFGRKVNIGFPGERTGFVNPPNRWSKYSPMVLSFGYEIMGTLLHIGKALSIIANGGHDVQPHIFARHDEVCSPGKRLFKQCTIDDMRTILQDPQTLFASVRKQFPLHGFRVFGKTGTARQVVKGKYSQKRHVFSFAGFIEKDDYRRVIVTFVKEPAKKVPWASFITAPLFARIAQRVAIHDVTHGEDTIT